MFYLRTVYVFIIQIHSLFVRLQCCVIALGHLEILHVFMSWSVSNWNRKGFFVVNARTKVDISRFEFFYSDIAEYSNCT
jgi:hypothetical protein